MYIYPSDLEIMEVGKLTINIFTQYKNYTKVWYTESGTSPTYSEEATKSALNVDPGTEHVPSGSSCVISQKTAPIKSLSDDTTYSVLEFTKGDIKQATNNFSTDLVLGNGGFGVV